ncbi:Glycoside hydrolase family 37 [Trinorchestia longiramus]|nr:Glycoside hydrolase family 37 [Trinorchestia longiramus]
MDKENKFLSFSFLVFVLIGNFLGCDSVDSASVATNVSDDCPIFCRGEILKEVQISKIFNQSSHFLHMKLRSEPDVIEENFIDLKNGSTDPLEPEILKKFIDKWFAPPGSDIETSPLPDWKARPRFIEEIHDKDMRNWLKELNEIWNKLSVRVPEDVSNNPQFYSQIYLPNSFVIPGGFFQEMYYWDSYWIIEGLLLCEMRTSARKMIENFLYLVKKYGFIPNGSRKYYLQRSQPPMLISAVEIYYQYTHDFNFIRANIDLLHREYQFWVANRSISIEKDGKNYTVFHYTVNTTEPRPESYVADIVLAQNLSDAEAKVMYGDIKAAAESGWDFSSRWFIDKGVENGDMKFIKTQIIAPIDLNTIMCRNAYLLSLYFERLGNSEQSAYYREAASSLNATISRLFWDEEAGFWFDFNLKTRKLENTFYGAGFVPLWAGAYGSERHRSHIVSKVIDYITSNNLTSYPGGIPTSLIASKQQWDFPNGWAPLQYFAVLGLHSAAVYNSTAGELANAFASKWVLNNYYGYINSDPHLMMEKYDVTKVGVPGSGGEYPVQAGFGWTNGVVMKFMQLYPHTIRATLVEGHAPIYVAAVLLLIMTTSLTMVHLLLSCLC